MKNNRTITAVLATGLLTTGLLAIGMLAVASRPALAQRDAPPGVNPYTNPYASSYANPYAGSMAARLSAEQMGPVRPGVYSTGDGSQIFTLSSYNGKYLLSFQNSPEVFVLSAEHGSLGARLLKYDTGATALRVSVWGGVTLYTQDAPGGMPATRQGDAPVPVALAVSQPELEAAMQDEASHLTYVQKVDLRFSADPAVMAADPQTRGRAFDALVNAAAGIERFLTQIPPAQLSQARAAFTRRVNSVKLTEGGKPAVALTGQTLLVSFVPDEGAEGHVSSLAVQQELSRLLATPAGSIAAK